jgi:hypothetical protein
MCYEYEIYIQEKFRKAKQQAEDLKKQAGKPEPEKQSEKKPETQEEPVPA